MKVPPSGTAPRVAPRPVDEVVGNFKLIANITSFLDVCSVLTLRQVSKNFAQEIDGSPATYLGRRGMEFRNQSNAFTQNIIENPKTSALWSDIHAQLVHPLKPDVLQREPETYAPAMGRAGDVLFSEEGIQMFYTDAISLLFEKTSPIGKALFIPKALGTFSFELLAIAQNKYHIFGSKDWPRRLSESFDQRRLDVFLGKLKEVKKASYALQYSKRMFNDDENSPKMFERMRQVGFLDRLKGSWPHLFANSDLYRSFGVPLEPEVDALGSVIRPERPLQLRIAEGVFSRQVSPIVWGFAHDTVKIHQRIPFVQLHLIKEVLTAGAATLQFFEHIFWFNTAGYMEAVTNYDAASGEGLPMTRLDSFLLLYLPNTVGKDYHGKHKLAASQHYVKNKAVARFARCDFYGDMIAGNVWSEQQLLSAADIFASAHKNVDEYSTLPADRTQCQVRLATAEELDIRTKAAFGIFEDDAHYINVLPPNGLILPKHRNFELIRRATASVY